MNDVYRVLPGLAESLRQELLLYDIDVHFYAPATFQSPSLELENKSTHDAAACDSIERDETSLETSR